MVARPEGGVVIVDDGHRAYLLFGTDGSFERAIRFANTGASGTASAETARAVSAGRWSAVPDPQSGRERQRRGSVRRGR